MGSEKRDKRGVLWHERVERTQALIDMVETIVGALPPDHTFEVDVESRDTVTISRPGLGGVSLYVRFRAWTTGFDTHPHRPNAAFISGRPTSGFKGRGWLSEMTQTALAALEDANAGPYRNPFSS